MLQSSAYRAKRWPRCSNSRSNSSSTMLLSKGDRGPPCGVPSSTGLTNPPSITPGFQKRPDQLQQSLIADPGFDSGHQFVVRNPVEEFLEVQVHAPSIALGDILLRLRHRLMSR